MKKTTIQAKKSLKNFAQLEIINKKEVKGGTIIILDMTAG